MTWQLWRQDDNGNRFLVGDFETRELAERKMAGLARGHHKQIYWISNTCEQGDADTGGSYR
ncbi:MAG: SPOR domain-containing protein [Desulfuromonadales bacterium]|nr:SPOR domain-containing protein [Desulfuromonadales bacterium]